MLAWIHREGIDNCVTIHSTFRVHFKIIYFDYWSNLSFGSHFKNEMLNEKKLITIKKNSIFTLKKFNFVQIGHNLTNKYLTREIICIYYNDKQLILATTKKIRLENILKFKPTNLKFNQKYIQACYKNYQNKKQTILLNKYF